jgi:nitroimidazol reductase NimA-like FMN-containing flavoprotein (pyridoxamine 5'-phosphate oxidase superfamily)
LDRDSVSSSENKKVSSAASDIQGVAMDMAKTAYHMRRKEREIKDKRTMDDLVAKRPFVTIAMCKDDEPYIVTVNHAYDPSSKGLYFHCANTGKKLDMLESNPRVIAQVLDDRGYVRDECDYDYLTVNLEGFAKKVVSEEEKIHALDLLLSKFEPGLDAEDARKKFIKQASFGKVAIYRIDISSMTGKMRVP